MLFNDKNEEKLNNINCFSLSKDMNTYNIKFKDLTDLRIG